MVKRVSFLALLALFTASCSEQPLGEGILFSTIGTRFLQDFVFVIQPDGSSLRTLLAPEASRSFPNAHGNSLRTHLALSVHGLTPMQTFENHLFLFHPVTRQLERLDAPDGTIGYAILSPDDERVALEFTPRLEPNQLQIWIYDLNRGAARKLTSPDGALDRFPTWRPDGQEILFLRETFSAAGLETTLMAVPAAGGAPSVIFGPEELIGAVAFARDCDCFAMWSRLGLEIVERADLNRRLVLPRATLKNLLVEGGSLALSRMQGKIAFSILAPEANMDELWTVGMDGSNPRPIHSFKDSRIIVSAFVKQ